jgi:hypothetical protein
MIYKKKVSLEKQKKRNKNFAYPSKLERYAKLCSAYKQVMPNAKRHPNNIDNPTEKDRKANAS